MKATTFAARLRGWLRGQRRWLLTAACLFIPIIAGLLFFASAQQPASVATTNLVATLAGASARRVAADIAHSVRLPSECMPGVQLINPDQPPAQRIRVYTVVAAPLSHEIRPDRVVPAWAFNDAVPAPAIRGVQDELLRVVLCNGLPDPVTIHWHGYPVPWQQDGVAGVTQNAVQPGAVYTYEFRLTIPGTYWYHSHQDSANQVDRGLYGMFVVASRTPQGPADLADVDANVVLADDAGNALWVSDPGAEAASANARRLYDPARSAWTANGRAFPYVEPLRVRQGQTVRLRVLNVGLQTHRLRLGGHMYRLVAVDGQPINGPQLTDAPLDVATGERYDLLFSADNPGAWSLHSVDADARASQMSLPISYQDGFEAPGGEDANWHPYAQPLDLLTYGTPDAAQPGLIGTVNFTRIYTFELVKDNGQWAAELHNMRMNGSYQPPPWLKSEAGVTMRMQGAVSGGMDHDQIAASFRPGDLVKFNIVNNTDSEHPIHIHGHFFQLLSRDGQPYSGAPIWRDTVTIWPHQTMVVGFKADNPGVWMLHCHILWHAAMGMGMLFNYEGIDKPYHTGGQYDNKPE